MDSSQSDGELLLMRLLATAWPELPPVAARCARYGRPWSRASRAFTRHEGDELVAHVGVMSLSLVVAGERLDAAGIHAVCTHPAHQGRGLFRQLMREALQFCRAQHQITLLFTTTPSLYMPLGFTEVPQHIAVWDVLPAPCGTAPSARRLSADSPADVALAERIVQNRAPVSRVYGVLDGWAVLLLNELWASGGFARFYYASDLEAILVYEVIAGTLRLFDVIAAVPPPLADVLARIATPFARVEVYFTLDTASASGATFRPYQDTSLLVLGACEVGQPFIHPPLSQW